MLNSSTDSRVCTSSTHLSLNHAHRQVARYRARVEEEKSRSQCGKGNTKRTARSNKGVACLGKPCLCEPRCSGLRSPAKYHHPRCSINNRTRPLGVGRLLGTAFDSSTRPRLIVALLLASKEYKGPASSVRGSSYQTSSQAPRRCTSLLISHFKDQDTLLFFPI